MPRKNTSASYNCARGWVRYLVRDKGYTPEEAAEEVRNEQWSINW